jgi:hypothetical protein
MKSTNLWGRIVAVAALLLLTVGGTAFAQLQTGNLYGTVTDEQGAALPGVTVSTTGQGAPQVQVTNAEGQFRFLGLAPGSYQLKAELEGFSTIDYPNIIINVGRNTSIEVKLSAAVEDVITVTAESPLLDSRKISTGATLNQTELEKIPTSRDPWSILSSTPGVLTDRINVGGNESGQQSTYTGPGSRGDQSVWAVDGMVITDMAALGSSPAYYDFDSFEEMQVTTGGSDSSVSTGGVVLNMVTKRGTNEWKGTGRYLDTDKSNQADLNFEQGELGQTGLHRSGIPPGLVGPDGYHFVPNNAAQASFKQGNRIVNVKDYGAEIGGPIIKDRLWVWGAYGRQKVNLLTVADVNDFTDLKTSNLKINAQLAASNSATLFALNSDKIKNGRNAGPTRPQETTWNQSKFGPEPTAAKVEDTHIFSSNFYLTGLFSKVNGGFQLAPQGGLDTSAYIDGASVWHNSFFYVSTERPQTQYKADASTFFNTGNLSHELKFGAGYRKARVKSTTTWGGGGLVYNGPAFFGLDEGINMFALQRTAGPNIEQKYTDLYVQDTLTVGNLTANIGLRYDKQEGKNLSRTIQASSLLPSVLPSVTYNGGDIGFDWTDITPRLGLTYALGADRKTLLRASYSRFSDQLGTGTGSILNNTGTVSYAYFYTTNPGNGHVGLGDLIDLDGNGIINANDVAFFSANIRSDGSLLQSNAVDGDLTAPLTDELLFSVEHALLPEFVVGVNLTYRKLTNFVTGRRLVFDDANAFCTACLNSVGRVDRRSDYEQVTVSSRVITQRDAAGVLHTTTVPFTTPDGKPYSVTYYRLRPNVSSRNGAFFTNSDREQEYKGAAITFNKRLANRWMLRGNFSYSDWTWSNVPQDELTNPTLTLGGGNREGDQVLQGSGTGSGAKGGVYINSKWSYSVNGLYQIAPDRPWGFNAAVNVYGRQGYPVPYFHRFTLGGNEQSAGIVVQATDRPDTYRLDDIHMLDARLEKEFTFSNFGLTIGADCFNVFNKAYVLQRNHRLQQGTSNDVRELTSPRVFRFGARLSFK